MKRSQKTLATQISVSPAQYARVSSSWKRRAPTPTMPHALASMATTWTPCHSGVSPAPCASKATACCWAVSWTTTRCVRSVRRARTRTRKACGTPVSPAPAAMTAVLYNPAPRWRMQFVRVSPSYWCQEDSHDTYYHHFSFCCLWTLGAKCVEK